MPKKRRRPPPPPSLPAESRGAEAVTVGWMLSVTTTLLCSAVAVLVWLFTRHREGYESALLFTGFLHFSAIVTGLISLVLLGFVLYGRRVPPPLSVTIGGVVIALAPLVAAFW